MIKVKQTSAEVNQKNQNIQKEISQLQKDIKVKDQQLKQRQNLSEMVSLSQRDEQLKQVAHELNQVLVEHEPLEYPKAIKRVIRKIRGSLRDDKYREQFLFHFEKVHPAFYQNVRTKFPKLNPSDNRLLAYIKMQLSSKEIAQIMGVNHESVNKSRYRLRKKLNLEKSMDLDKFVAEI